MTDLIAGLDCVFHKEARVHMHTRTRARLNISTVRRWD